MAVVVRGATAAGQQHKITHSKAAISLSLALPLAGRQFRMATLLLSSSTSAACLLRVAHRLALGRFLFQFQAAAVAAGSLLQQSLPAPLSQLDVVEVCLLSFFLWLERAKKRASGSVCSHYRILLAGRLNSSKQAAVNESSVQQVLSVLLLKSVLEVVVVVIPFTAALH